MSALVSCSCCHALAVVWIVGPTNEELPLCGTHLDQLQATR